MMICYACEGKKIQFLKQCIPLFKVQTHKRNLSNLFVKLYRKDTPIYVLKYKNLELRQLKNALVAVRTVEHQPNG
jgi:hypothetical protein